MTGSIVFDEDAVPVSTVTLNPGDPVLEFTQQSSVYQSFTAQIGSLTLDGGNGVLPFDSEIRVRDGVGTLQVHLFSASYTNFFNQILSPGVVLDSMLVSVSSTVIDEPFTGVSIPSVAELNNLNINNFFAFNLIDETSLQFLGLAQWTDVTFSELAVVPLPAALPLYGTGLALMGFIGWRRKQRKAAV